MSDSFYREIVNEHNLRPYHKRGLPDADLELRGVNPGCGDDITLQLKTEGGIITAGGFVGDGCAISQASADIMLDLVIGKTTEEALALSERFLRMIRGEASDEELEALFNVKIPERQWQKLQTLGDVADAVMKRLPG